MDKSLAADICILTASNCGGQVLEKVIIVWNELIEQVKVQFLGWGSISFPKAYPACDQLGRRNHCCGRPSLNENFILLGIHSFKYWQLIGERLLQL